MPLAALSEKDCADLDFICELGIDWLALSFVQRADDIIEASKLVAGRAAIISKIEKPSAVKSFEDILKVSDGIMVARGDLGVELPVQNVPPIQKRLVRKCRAAAKPVIVATQMLESMVESPMPTRAEVSDVATAIYEGSDAIMLSAETSIGKYPSEVVTQISKIISTVEYSDMISVPESPPKIKTNRYTTKFICYHAAQIANETKIAAITTLTHSGYTGFQVSSWRPHSNILVFTSNKRILCRLNLLWLSLIHI